MRTKLLVLALALAACGDDGNMVRNDGSVTGTPDAPEFAPSITSLTASPSMFAANTPTMVTFTWTLLVQPTYPEPTCTIDNGVGTVTSGTPVSVTITGMTLMTLTCSNRAGMSQRQVILNTLPAAPVIGTFSVTPTTVAPNTSTPYTFTWTYSNSPSPQPTCSIDGGVTNITSGTPVSMTLTQARTFRLRCTNSQGTAYSGSTVQDVTVAVNECGTAYAQCDAHATCTDTTNGYTCACNTGASYAGDGDTCTYQTTNSADCDTNATFLGTSCVCKAGYFGSGQTGDCKRARFSFVTGSTYTGAGIASLANADAICAAKAASYTAAPYTTGLPGTYVAWLSDVNNDAYCRVQTDGSTGHLNGKRSNNCGLGSLPVAAGPWVRVGDWKQWAPTIDKLLAPNYVAYYPSNRDELGTEIASATDRVWTGTDAAGTYVAASTCTDWTLTSGTGVAGDVHGGGQSWTQTGTTNPSCASAFHLRCVEVSAVAPAALPPRHPANTKKAFLTSVTGNGNLMGWPDNYGGTSGIAASDAICQARARYAGYANASTYKAWMATYPYSVNAGYGITTKLLNTALGYARPDGVVMGTSRADMLDGKLGAAWEQTETNTYPGGNLDSGVPVGTNLTASGAYYTTSSTSTCNYWQSGTTSYYDYFGRSGLLDGRAFHIYSTTGNSAYYQYCDQPMRLYCVEDQ